MSRAIAKAHSSFIPGGGDAGGGGAGASGRARGPRPLLRLLRRLVSDGACGDACGGGGGRAAR